MTPLRLLAFDEDDLTVVSAHVQDAVMRVGDLSWDAPAGRVVMGMNRYAWETRRGLFKTRAERHRSVLHFDRVRSMRSTGIRRDRPEDVLSLLAVRFLPQEAPAGTVELVFSGDAALRLSVECIEARLTDLGAAWEASSPPRHRS